MENTVEVTIFNASGAVDCKGLADDWTRFFQGTYTKELPTRVGRYPAFSEQGMQIGEVLCYKDTDGSLKTLFRASVSDEDLAVFEGWIWSAPVPVQMPETVPIYDTFAAKCYEVQKWKREKEAAARMAERRSKLSLVAGDKE